MAYRVLYHGQPSDSSAAVYSSDNTFTTITAFTVVNTTASPVTLTAWITDDGVAVADASLIFEALSIPANDQIGIDVAVVHTMGRGQELHLQASAATSLTVRISGDVHD